MNDSHLNVEELWGIINNEPAIWDFIVIKNQSFYFNHKNNLIFLSSFQKNTLPLPQYKMTILGKLLTKSSQFANIMSCRPGTEDVTFYALVNSPQAGILGRIADKKMLSIAAPPLKWRRAKIKEKIQKQIQSYINMQQSFLFIDIGCGAGFDSLEIERIMHRFETLTQIPRYSCSYASLNIDIDKKWLNNNKKLSEELFGDSCNILRENISAFDFLTNESYHSMVSPYDNLIISCNGFAEFLNDEQLLQLYIGIHNLIKEYKGGVSIILPFAGENKKQESIGEKIGFQFRTKNKNTLITLIKEIFKNYNVSYIEKHSQIVINVERHYSILEK